MSQQFDISSLMQTTANLPTPVTNIYLGGVVSEFLEDKPSYAAKWREEFPALLSKVAEEGAVFRCHNPCEGQYSDSLEYEIADYNKFRFTPQYIFDKCVHQILMSDILVMNFLESKGYYTPGSFWEMGFAFALKNKTIILVDNPEGKAHSHPILQSSVNFMASNLYEAAQYCVYLRDKVKDTKML